MVAFAAVVVAVVLLATGRISTCEPGRKAETPPRSTVKPPLTRPTMAPMTGSFLANTPSRRVQASSRRALSRLMTASPRAFSIRSRNTSTVSPTLRIGLPASSTPNSFTGMRPSVFRPTSTIAKSFSIAATKPLTTCRLPGFGSSPPKTRNAREPTQIRPAASVVRSLKPMPPASAAVSSTRPSPPSSGDQEISRPPSTRPLLVERDAADTAAAGRTVITSPAWSSRWMPPSRTSLK